MCISDPSYGKTAHLLDSPRLVAIETHTCEPPDEMLDKRSVLDLE